MMSKDMKWGDFRAGCTNANQIANHAIANHPLIRIKTPIIFISLHEANRESVNCSLLDW
jgi:hypothetical protein